MADETLYDSALETVNTSIMFLVLLVLGILLSLKSVLLQRESLCTAREGGNTDCLEAPFPFQRASGAIAIGALGYFFTLALRGQSDACRTGSRDSIRLSQVNLWASLVVLAAAILRFWALNAAQQGEDEVLPDEELPA